MKLLTTTENEEFTQSIYAEESGKTLSIHVVSLDYDDEQVAAFQKQADMYVCCLLFSESDWNYENAYLKRIALDADTFVIHDNKLYGFYFDHRQSVPEGLLYANASNVTYSYGYDQRGRNYDWKASCFLVPPSYIDFPFAVGDRYNKGTYEYEKLKKHYIDSSFASMVPGHGRWW